MKQLSIALILTLSLMATFPATTASAPHTSGTAPERARIHATLRISQIVLGIEVIIPTLIYSVQNQNTSQFGTVIDSNNYDVVVQEGDVLYLNSFGLPLAIYYTVTAADIASGSIHVSVLS